MSLLRMFFQNVHFLAAAAKWDLLAEYFSLIRLITAIPEAVVVPGTPTDKRI